MNKKTYAVFVVLLPLLALVGIGLSNRFVDPYQIFSADRDGVFTNKPALHSNMRLHKAYQVRLQKPDTLILGSSKAIQGIPDSHPYFDDQRVYNLAMPLASMKELTYLLRHANEVQPLNKVVLALDFLSFNVLARQDGPAAGFVPERLLGDEHSVGTTIQDYLSALISLDAIGASVKSWKFAQSQHDNLPSPTGISLHAAVPEHRILAGLGGRIDAEIRSRLNDGGHRSNTLKIEEFFTSAVYLPLPLKQYSFQSKDQDSLYWFEQFLRTTYENDIELAMFISPSHARLNELIDAAGLWPQFEYWKRRLVALNELMAKEYGQPVLALWDFSAPSDITSEPFPEAGDSEYQMKYFYEAIHFNQHTGGLVLDRLLDQASSISNNTSTSTSTSTSTIPIPIDSNGGHPDTFGVELTSDNIDLVLEGNRQKQWIFRQQHPDYKEELSNIMSTR